MEQFTVGKNEDGRRLDAVVLKILPKAGKGFVYKMLRKKNIVLNDRKADGSDRVSEGDIIRFYLSDDTYREFGGILSSTDKKEALTEAKVLRISDALHDLRLKDLIIYEDDDIMLIDKPAGMLSQKADPNDVSVNELIIGYLMAEGKTDEQALRTFRPSVCNRLDRNTSGIICAGVSLTGSRELTRLIREKKADKYYMCIVSGNMTGDTGRLKSYLSKDEKENKVRISDKEFEGSVPVEIEYSPLRSENGFTLLKVKLITGKSHQIRAQLAAIDHPIAGDMKYGNRELNRKLFEKYGVKRQLLTAYSFTFPENTVLEAVKGKTFEIKLPDDFFLRP